MKKILSLALMVPLSAAAVHAQERASASRAVDLQVGATYTTANSDYTANRIRGFGFYADFDVREHYGLELNFHQLGDPNTIVYERTYEVGGRYIYRANWLSTRVAPYAKLMYGRGVFNYPPPYPPPYPQDRPAANLAYNMFVIGGGIDFHVHPRINVRGEYEYQHWSGFPPNGLTPSLATFGVAYHFPAGTPRR